MNAQAVKQEIQNIIANRYRKQHAPAKWQIAKAAELGLTDILAEIDADFGRGMNLGHSDYTAILDAAADNGKTSGGMTADREWSESTAPASALYKLLNEVEKTTNHDVDTALLEVESGETVISTSAKGRFARVEKEAELYRLEFGTDGLGLDRENSAAGLYTREAIIEQMAVWGKGNGWEVLVYE